MARGAEEKARGKDPEAAQFPKRLQDICSRHTLPYSPAMAAKFRRFYRDEVSKLRYSDPSITKIYMHAMVYKYTKTRRPKKTFLDGFRLQVFEKALKAVQDWLSAAEKAPRDVPAGRYRTVCNLYSMRGT